MLKTLRKNACFFLCMTIIFIFMIYQCTQKKGTFVDELLTYDLSNRQSPRVEYMVSYITSTSPSSVWNDINDILKNGKENSRIYKDLKKMEKQQEEVSFWHDKDYFSRFITAEKGHRFDFLSVMYNAVYDSAPPFYYYWIHFICSLFPGTFSLWYGLAVNILFLMLTCGLLYYLTKKYFGGTKYAFLIALCYAMSIGGISTLFIIRMYAIYTFFVLAFLGINLHIAHNGFSFTKKSRIAYVLCAVLGFYTQYYFIIFAGILIGTIIAFLFFQKEGRGKIKPYFTASLAAAVISLVIWPFSIKHIFFDSFGSSTFSNAASGDFLHKVTVYLKIVADSLFAGQPILLALFSLAAIAGILWILRKYKTGNDKKLPYISLLKALMLFLPAMGYLFLVAISAPFLADRYIMCIFPILLLGMYFLFRTVLDALTRHGFLILCLFGALITIAALSFVPKNYTYPDRKERDAFMEEAENAVCIYISEKNGWMYKSCLDIMSVCKKTAPCYPEQISSAEPIPLPDGGYDKILICIASSFQQEDTLRAVIEQYGLESKQITGFPDSSDGYTLMYLLE